MSPEDLVKGIPGVMARIQGYFEGSAEARAWLSVCAGLLVDTDLPAFAQLLEQEDFKAFLAARGRSSRKRMESLSTLLLKRLGQHCRPDLVAGFAGVMAQKRYQRIERSFFIVPVDEEACKLFDHYLLEVAASNQDRLGDYLELCGSAGFSQLRKSVNSLILAELMERLAALLLGKKRLDPVLDALDMLLSPICQRLLGEAHDANMRGPWHQAIFGIFNTHPDPVFFKSVLDVFGRRYPSESGPPKIMEALALWPVMSVIGDNAGRQTFKEFLKLYGNTKDEFTAWLWALALEQEPPDTLKAFALFVSTPFLSMVAGFRHKIDILKLLVGNIFTVLMETEIRSLKVDVYGIILKLLLKLRVEEAFLDRRAAFMAWLKTQTRSERIEAELVRVFLFEYIFIATGIIPVKRPLQITKTISSEHNLLVQQLDEAWPSLREKKDMDPDALFTPVLKAFRNLIWQDTEARFAQQSYGLQEIRSATQSIDAEDSAISGLENLEADEFSPWHLNFMDYYRRDPDSCHVALGPDHWCRITLDDAMPSVQSALLPIIGSVPVSPDTQHPEPGLAYTNGSEIWLMQWASYFRDPREPLEANRNLSFYVGLALHEAAHIIGGTFAVDQSLFISKLDKPGLYQFIHNVLEDWRVEAFLIRRKVHPLAAELIGGINEWLTVRNFMIGLDRPPGITDFLSHIFDEASACNSTIRTDLRYVDRMTDLLNRDLPSGRFPSPLKLAEYAIQRLEHLDILNPVLTHLLCLELYEALRFWPEAMSIIKPEDYGPKGPNGTGPSWTPKVQPLNPEELKGLYDEYNRNPQAFLGNLGLKALAEEAALQEAREQAATGKSGKAGKTGKGSQPGAGGQAEQSPDSAPGSSTTAPLPEGEGTPSGMRQAFDPAQWYQQSGTIDSSTRTRVDELMALAQTTARSKEQQEALQDQEAGSAGEGILDFIATGGGRRKGKKDSRDGPTRTKKGRISRIYSLNPATKSRTILSEVETFMVDTVDHAWLRRFRRWEHLSQQVLQLMAELLPRTRETHEESMLDGDLDMDRLIDILSSPNKVGPQAFLESWHESSRSRDLEVIIGMDTSGSTASPLPGGFTVLDIEKAFAMIFGAALSQLTDRIHYLAFNSATSTNVYEARNLQCISTFTADQANRDGDFIRYCTQRLIQSPMRHRYLFLITDGMPVSVNYEGKEALDDTLLSMRECRAAGIKLVYFNIDQTQREYFTAFRAEATFAEHFASPADLLPRIPDLVRTMVKSTD